MISTLTKQSFLKSRFKRVLGATVAVLIAGSAASMAASAGENEINAYLPPGVTVSTASAGQYLAATLAAIASPKVKASTAPSTIIAVALKKFPNYAPLYAEAGLNRVYGQNGYIAAPSLTTTSKKASEVNKIISSSVKLGLTTTGNEQLRADEAAAIIAPAVRTVRALVAGAGTPKVLTPLELVIKSAVKTTLSTKVSGADGLEGVITGAISQYAGVSNSDITTAVGDSPSASDSIVMSILATAGKNAPKRLIDIARAAGYAFAATYRVTTSDPSEISQDSFVDKNATAIVSAIVASLSTKVKDVNSVVFSQVRVAVTLGIGAAYGSSKVLGYFGVNAFAYNNSTGSEVTNISGL